MEIEDLKRDNSGHLLNWKLWDENIAAIMARSDGFQLSKQHWQIIHLVREIYQETETSPPMRLLIKVIKNKLNDELASSRALYRLFPDGPVRLACKYAGLPKPKHCL